MRLGEVVLLVVVVYVLPLAVLACGGFCAAIVAWVDLRLLGSRLAFTGDLNRKWELQRNTERFRHLRAPSFWYLLWTLGNAGVQAVMLYRISSRLLIWRHKMAADIVRRVAIATTGIDISPYARIGRGFSVHHGSGVVIGKNTSIGENVTVYHDVTTGSGRPRLEDGVIVWPGARIIGDVTVGRNSEVGANAVVLADVPPDSVAMGVPAERIIPRTLAALGDHPGG